ncbi:hypothetical protein NGA_0118300 [Nannochloropsis gaditana CCMP526]|nr:hypothetical protein NGA_0118300 [Nannochloropsis gaditana CCMP526]EKU20990.1 hypothetical protein NGA_0118300 [Nannochloropsis gaditana CCMP526]|eukprot:XP_005855372.1 hypothetical protein NGA_0118300 [Nannochloropsis gaditana CCMP526]
MSLPCHPDRPSSCLFPLLSPIVQDDERRRKDVQTFFALRS